MTNRLRAVLYLDIDGVLQYADGDRWKPRLEAGDFLKWAVARFECRWLTNWVEPNRTAPKELGITVPDGIVEVRWRETFAGAGYPFKAAAIRDNEPWLWLEDEPSEFDLADLKRRGRLDNLIRVNPRKPYILLSQICGILEDRLDHDEMDE
jgi:hypothetical protein